MINAIIGGAIIGIAVSLMLFFNGRVTGVSGIVSGAINPVKDETAWRWFFITGLLAGGFALKFFYPQSFIQQSSQTNIDYVIGGLLVGFGTLLGSGCTSGHGVCGISRFSFRSILATITFISFGVISVLAYKFLRGAL
jgi:uncharacterized membrane protein YedE/YeeE